MKSENVKVSKIPLYEIRDPEHAMRKDVYDDALKELASSIKENGLIQPIVVAKRKDHYEVVAGHRRFAAHKLLGYGTIDSIIRKVDEREIEEIKINENLNRADVNPVDEAQYLHHLMDRLDLGVDDLAVKIARSPTWVKGRLALLDYPDYLREFVEKGDISLATASILNEIPDERIKEDYSWHAAQQGLTSTRAKYWLDQARIGRTDVVAISEEATAEQKTEAQKAEIMYRCFLDGKMYPANQMINAFVWKNNFSEYSEMLASEQDGNPQLLQAEPDVGDDQRSRDREAIHNNKNEQ